MGTSEVKRVVIDTNVLISAMLFGGIPGKLIPMWKEGYIQPLCSKDIIGEYLRVLAYPKFKLSESEMEYLLSREILPWFHVVKVKAGRNSVKKDPQDDMFIWCAVEGKADVLISGDDHLLKLKGSPVPILSVTKFLKTINTLIRDQVLRIKIKE